MKPELYCDKVEAICSHVRAMFDVIKENDFVPRDEMTEEIVKDLAEKYGVNLNLLHKILFR